MIFRQLIQRIYRVDYESGDSGTYDVVSLFRVSGMSFGCKTDIGIVLLTDCHCNHANTRLSVDLFDFNFSELLSVTVFLVISSFAFVFVNDDLAILTVFNYRSGNTGIGYICSNF